MSLVRTVLIIYLLTGHLMIYLDELFYDITFIPQPSYRRLVRNNNWALKTILNAVELTSLLPLLQYESLAICPIRHLSIQRLLEAEEDVDTSHLDKARRLGEVAMVSSNSEWSQFRISRLYCCLFWFSCIELTTRYVILKNRKPQHESQFGLLAPRCTTNMWGVPPQMGWRDRPNGPYSIIISCAILTHAPLHLRTRREDPSRFISSVLEQKCNDTVRRDRMCCKISYSSSIVGMRPKILERTNHWLTQCWSRIDG